MPNKVKTIKPSVQAIQMLEFLNIEERKLSNILPICKSDCECQEEIRAIKRNEKPMRYVECKNPHKQDMNLYLVISKKSDEEIATVYATDETLKDWLDCRYIAWHDKDSWHGCLTVNVSPFDESLGFECADGTDTRDFRANRTLKQKDLKERLKNLPLRDFASDKSPFEIKIVKRPSVLTKFKRMLNISTQLMREHDFARKHL